MVSTQPKAPKKVGRPKKIVTYVPNNGIYLTGFTKSHIVSKTKYMRFIRHFQTKKSAIWVSSSRPSAWAAREIDNFMTVEKPTTVSRKVTYDFNEISSKKNQIVKDPVKCFGNSNKSLIMDYIDLPVKVILEIDNSSGYLNDFPLYVDGQHALLTGNDIDGKALADDSQDLLKLIQKIRELKAPLMRLCDKILVGDTNFSDEEIQTVINIASTDIKL